MDRLDSNMTAEEYMTADDNLCTCMNFKGSDKWRKELPDIMCDEVESQSYTNQPAVHVQGNHSGDEDEEEPEVEFTNIAALMTKLFWVSSNLLLFFTQRGKEELSGTKLKVVQKLQVIKVNQSMEL